MPLRMMRAQGKSLNPSIGRVRRLIARGSCPVVLDVVQILCLANLDGCFEFGVDRLERGQIGAAPVDGHRLG